MSILGYSKIKGLVYTEKSNKQLENGKYHFHVESSCSKSEIGSLVAKVFGVEVTKVNMINTPEQPRRFKGVQGEKSPYKKAIVTLKKGQSINFGS